MIRRIRPTAAAVAAIVTLATVTGHAAAQDDEAKDKTPPKPAAEKRPDPAEMLREIAREMASVEKMLLEARTDRGRGAQRIVEKIEKLLDNAKKSEGQVINRIDKLLEEIKRREKEQQRQQQQQANQGSSKNKQKRPKPDQQHDPQRDEDRFRNQNRDDKPRDKNDPKNQKGSKPPKDSTKRTDHPDKAGAWGRLPDRLFKLLTSREQTVFPPEFRNYLERYFRRLNENSRTR